MTTAAPSAALATIQAVFTDAERVALAGFLAGYRGLTREAYALDLRQFASWCRGHLAALIGGEGKRNGPCSGIEWPAQGSCEPDAFRRACRRPGDDHGAGWLL